MNPVLSNLKILLKASIPVDTNDFKAFANVWPAISAGIAVSAIDNGLYNDVIPYFDAIHCAASFHHFAYKLMAYDPWIGGYWGGAVINMNVRAADSCSFNLDQHFIVLLNHRHPPLHELKITGCDNL
jgi:hypothetical protein